MNQRAVMRNTLSARCRLFISQPENYTNAMGVYNQTATSQFHPNIFTSVVHQCGNWSMSRNGIVLYAYILFIQSRKIWTNLLLVKFVAPGCRHIAEALHSSCVQKAYLNPAKEDNFSNSRCQKSLHGSRTNLPKIRAELINVLTK